MPEYDLSELKYQIALTMIPSIGPVTARKLIDKIGTARGVLTEKRYMLEKIEGIGPGRSGSFRTSAMLEEAEKEIAFMERHRIKAIFYKDPEYPALLLQCHDAPILIYTRGESGLNSKHSLSVVGTRRASPYGREMCRELIRELSSLLDELVIMSGLAYGIDVIAHRTALECGIPTVAVLGHGMATIYPWTHRETAKLICNQGTLVTDFSSGTGPERNNFLRRNRIIAGLSHATLVIESPEKGGALITADLASSYDRIVLAVPGRSTDKRSRGCNNLVKDNIAAMVDTPSDILKQLNWEIPAGNSERSSGPVISPEGNEEQILSLIKKQPGINPGSLSLQTGIPISQILALLTEMELKQWISIEPGNQYHLRVNLT